MTFVKVLYWSGLAVAILTVVGLPIWAFGGWMGSKAFTEKNRDLWMGRGIGCWLGLFALFLFLLQMLHLLLLRLRRSRQMRTRPKQRQLPHPPPFPLLVRRPAPLRCPAPRALWACRAGTGASVARKSTRLQRRAVLLLEALRALRLLLPAPRCLCPITPPPTLPLLQPPPRPSRCRRRS